MGLDISHAVSLDYISLFYFRGIVYLHVLHLGFRPKTSGQIILRNFWEFYIAPSGQITK